MLLNRHWMKGLPPAMIRQPYGQITARLYQAVVTAKKYEEL